MFEPTYEKLTVMVDQPQEELPQLISIAWLMPYTFFFILFLCLLRLGSFSEISSLPLED